MNHIAVQTPRPRWDVISVTVALHLLALLVFVPGTFSWAALGVALFLHWLTMGIGIGMGFHRLISHRSFQVPTWLEYALVLFGTLAGQGGVFGWVGYHRLHHLHTDQDLDPHDSTKGMWWSHISWLMHEVPVQPQLPKFTKDIAQDPFYRFCHKQYIPLQIALALILYAIGGLPFLVWGVFVRLFAGFHTTCLVNSACHRFGYQNYQTGDHSTNCWWVALLTYGEGWHNNHHANQSSACNSRRWWEVDILWFTILTCERLGLARKIRKV